MRPGPGWLGIGGLAISLGVGLSTPGFAGFEFEPPTTYPARGAYSVALLKFNDDQALDLAVSQNNDGFSEDSVLIYLNDGVGGFIPGPAFRCSSGVNQVATGDLDHEGGDDIVTACVHGYVVVILNRPSGCLTTAYLVANNPAYVVAVDIDHDDDLDLVVARNGTTGSIRFLVNNGAGLFSSGLQVPNLGGITQIGVADFNGDGHVDVFPTATSTRVNILYGDGTGNFTRTWFTWGSQGGCAGADFDLDGHADLAFMSGSYLDVFWGNGLGGFDGPTTVIPFGSGRLTLLDWNRDGLPDLVVGGSLIVDVFAYVENLGARTFAVEAFDIDGFATDRWASGDIDGDGWQDLAGGGTSVVKVLRNTNGPVAAVEQSLPATRLSISPNPAVQRLVVGFELAGAEAATMELWDVQGRRVDRRDVGSFGRGRHQITFGNSPRLAPGIYLVRLIQGERVTTARACLIE